MRKILAIVLLLLVFPVFLFIYQPSIQLGALGLLLGGIGMTLSPIAMLILCVLGAMKLWQK